MSWLWHWFEVHSGTVNESGPYYGFWSGFGSDIAEFAIFGAVVGGYRRVNCHIKLCPRISHHEYELDGVKYHLCRKHHPRIDVRPSAADFANDHARMKESANARRPARD